MRVICHFAAKPSIMKGTTASSCSSGKIRRTSGHKKYSVLLLQQIVVFHLRSGKILVHAEKDVVLPGAKRMDLNPLQPEGCE